ncbi:hypothetical protein BD324DRAFT_609547 [Kockovaella imperatae]|uniref:Nucleotide-diphospho-sugar transferase n=1 Tax=Kockovaella imperatae TaxID=4999 RepID=A0A1Y1UDZ1_9TREE|nr:hypothetical protein BD324DRAFT_609547 [Kockovaella imperatae]ORX35295.1 hypothetical protein BD324DRAFT_609547 [Kockovaella imperatae]
MDCETSTTYTWQQRQQQQQHYSTSQGSNHCLPTPPITPTEHSPPSRKQQLPSQLLEIDSALVTGLTPHSFISFPTGSGSTSRPLTPAPTPSPPPAIPLPLPFPSDTMASFSRDPPKRPHNNRCNSTPMADSLSTARRGNLAPVSTTTSSSSSNNNPPYLQNVPPPRSPSGLMPRIIDSADASTSYPRRRVSLSINGSPNTILPPPVIGSTHPYPQPHSASLQHNHARHHPRRRARTMSFPVRTSKHVPCPRPLYRSRRTILLIVILISLFLVGTVIVLSSVSYYLAIPAWAFLSEDEVPWSTLDAIKSLRYSPMGTARQHKREAAPEAANDQQRGLDDDFDWFVSDANEEDSDRWDVDGAGSGGYWMEKEWDGRVRGANDWTKLYNVTARPGERIPRIIHQTWKDDMLPVKWRKAFKECREGMPDYEHMLWTDEVSREFIKANYPAHLHMYDSYKYPIQRADSIRYFVLHHFGGVYMDLDIGCRRRLDPLLQGDWEVILPVTKPVGVSNDLILSSKGSAFIDDTIHALPAWNHEWVSNYPTVMFSTGPMFLSAQFSIYTSAHPITSSHPRSEVRILPKSLYGKNAPVETVPHSFFAHFYGSSWHSDDAGFISFLGKWGKGLMVVGSIVVVVGVLRLVSQKFMRTADPRFQLLSVLPTSSSIISSKQYSHSGNGVEESASISSAVEAISSQHLPQDIASTLKRAGNLILAAPATLLSGDRRSRRKTGLLYFVPALFQPGPVTSSRRGRTSSESSQLPLRRSRKERERDRDRMNPPPPPYDPLDNGSTPQAASHMIHDEPDSMEEDDLSPSMARSLTFPARGNYSSSFLRDIESGSSSATDDGDDGEQSSSPTAEADWSEWASSNEKSRPLR